MAIRYLVRDVAKFKSVGVEAQEVIDRLSIWKSSYRKEKMKKQFTRAAEELDTTSEDLKTINMLTNNERALQRVLQIVETTNPTDEDINFIGTYLFIAPT